MGPRGRITGFFVGAHLKMFQSLQCDSETECESESSFSFDLNLNDNSVVEELIEKSNQLAIERDQHPPHKAGVSIDYRKGKFVKVLRKTETTTLYRSAIIRDNAIDVICSSLNCHGTIRPFDSIPADDIVHSTDGWNPGSRLTRKDGRNYLINFKPQIFVSWLVTSHAAPICEAEWTAVDIRDVVSNVTVSGKYNIPNTNIDIHSEMIQAACIVPEVRNWLSSPLWTFSGPTDLTEEQQDAFQKLNKLGNGKAQTVDELLAYIANEIPLIKHANQWTKAGAPFVEDIEIESNRPPEDLYLLSRDGYYWVVPSQVNEVFHLGKSSVGMRNLVARYCNSLRKATVDERLLLIENRVLGKKAPTTNLVLLSDVVAYLDRIGKPVSDSLRRLCAN